MNNGSFHDLVQRNEIIRVLENQEARSFISEHRHEDPVQLSLNKHSSDLFNTRIAIQLISYYQKAKDKLPLWVENLLALDRRSLEQSTSQRLAEWRKDQVKGEHLLELTGGLGVDSVYLSQSFKRVTSLEINPVLTEFAGYNDIRLGIGNVERMTKDAGQWEDLHEGQFTTVFIDPDRRPSGNRRVSGLAHSEPPVLNWLPKLLSRSERVLIKCSPMEDLSELIRTVPGLYCMYCISIQNEMKEILLELKQGAAMAGIRAIEMDKETVHTFTADSSTGRVPVLSGAASVILEPAAAIRKAGLGEAYASKFELKALSTVGEYYAADHIPENFCGRWWSVVLEGKLNWKTLKQELNSRNINQLNILRKHFPMSSEQVRAKLKIAEGGEYYLILSLNRQQESRYYLVK